MSRHYSERMAEKLHDVWWHHQTQPIADAQANPDDARHPALPASDPTLKPTETTC